MFITKSVAWFLEAVYRERIAIQEEGEKIGSFSEITRWSILAWLAWVGFAIPQAVLTFRFGLPFIPSEAGFIMLVVGCAGYVIFGFVRVYDATIEASEEKKLKEIQNHILYCLPVVGPIFTVGFLVTMTKHFVLLLLGWRMHTTRS